MILNPPFSIGARLLPAIKIGNGTISMEYDGQTSDGRIRYRYHIDLPDFEWSRNDLRSGVGSGNLQQGFSSLLSFLSAAAESYSRHGMEGENAEMFPEKVCEWAEQNSDELCLAQLQMDEEPGLIQE